jgi:hypothetical protein
MIFDEIKTTHHTQFSFLSLSRMYPIVKRINLFVQFNAFREKTQRKRKESTPVSRNERRFEVQKNPKKSLQIQKNPVSPNESLGDFENPESLKSPIPPWTTISSLRTARRDSLYLPVHLCTHRNTSIPCAS